MPRKDFQVSFSRPNFTALFITFLNTGYCSVLALEKMDEAFQMGTCNFRFSVLARSGKLKQVPFFKSETCEV